MAMTRFCAATFQMPTHHAGLDRLLGVFGLLASTSHRSSRRDPPLVVPLHLHVEQHQVSSARHESPERLTAAAIRGVRAAVIGRRAMPADRRARRCSGVAPSWPRGRWRAPASRGLGALGVAVPDGVVQRRVAVGRALEVEVDAGPAGEQTGDLEHGRCRRPCAAARPRRSARPRSRRPRPRAAGRTISVWPSRAATMQRRVHVVEAADDRERASTSAPSVQQPPDRPRRRRSPPTSAAGPLHRRWSAAWRSRRSLGQHELSSPTTFTWVSYARCCSSENP